MYVERRVKGREGWKCRYRVWKIERVVREVGWWGRYGGRRGQTAKTVNSL